MSKIIVGLTGAAGVGKSAVAKELIANYGFKRYALAAPLKLMLAGLLTTWGYNQASTDYWIDGDGKERPCPALGYKTPREAMQYLGTEYGRENLNEELWVNHLLQRINNSDDQFIVVDDVRFDNEAEALITHTNAHIFRVVVAPGTKTRRAPPPHASENGVHDDFIDDEVLNPFTFEGVAEAVRHTIIPLLNQGVLP